MSDQFIGEVRIVGFAFAPRMWAFCNGQIMSISQNTALFSILGTQFGGDGRTTFGLPNLQGSLPIDAGQGPGLSQYDVGQFGGSETITLIQTESARHTHNVQAQATDAGDNRIPSPTLNLAKSQSFSTATTPQAQLDPKVIGPAGGVGPSGAAQPHNNLMPGLALNFCIALQGIFPSRN
jgi:microcystin-dependent protein